MNAGLVRLALRRSLAGGLWLLALAFVAWRASWTPSAALSGLLDGVDPEHVARALTRRGVWSALLLLAVPWAVSRAAAAVPRWRRGEVAWLASAPVSRARVVASTALGQALAAAAVVAGIALVAESAAARAAGAPLLARRAPEALRPLGALDLGPALLELPGQALVFEIETPDEAAFLRVQLVAIAGGNAAHVRLSLTRGSESTGSECTGAETAVHGRAELRAPIPAGDGSLEVELERLGPGPIAAVVGAELLERVPDERLAGAALALRSWVALLAWQALAFGCGAWMRAELAAGLALALALLACMLPGAPLAGAGLPGALALAGEGLVPGRLGLVAALGTALALIAGWWLAHAGLAGWRQR